MAHTLYFFTEEGDLVLDPMAGGGVVPDVCLLFGRKCWAFDVATRPERPEIEYHYWELGNMQWPDIKKPDLIFFDPPYFTKKEKEYQELADEAAPLSSLPRSDYLAFFAEFLALAHKNSKPTTRIAFLNAGWRDFESTPALEEDPETAIFIRDYENILEETGWQLTHEIQCPMSNARFGPAIHSQMQKSKILGTVERTLLMAKWRRNEKES